MVSLRRMRPSLELRFQSNSNSPFGLFKIAESIRLSSHTKSIPKGFLKLQLDVVLNIITFKTAEIPNGFIFYDICVIEF